MKLRVYSESLWELRRGSSGRWRSIPNRLFIFISGVLLILGMAKTAVLAEFLCGVNARSSWDFSPSVPGYRRFVRDAKLNVDSLFQNAPLHEEQK